MKIVSNNIVLLHGGEGIALYIERVTSCITDEVVYGAVQTALLPAEAIALAHALLEAARTSATAPRLSAARQSIDAALQAARTHAQPAKGFPNA